MNKSLKFTLFLIILTIFLFLIYCGPKKEKAEQKEQPVQKEKGITQKAKDV